jgi:hypothetical protein
MPFRDIDFNKVKHDTEVMEKLNREIAIINASANRDLEKVEFLSGVKLYTPDPIKEQIERQQAVARQQPVLDKLNELVELSSNQITTGQIADIIRKNIPAITLAHPPEQLEYFDAPAEAPTRSPKKETKEKKVAKVNLDAGEDREMLEEYDFPLPSKLVVMSLEDLKKLDLSVGHKLKQLGQIKKNDKSVSPRVEKLQYYHQSLKSIIGNKSSGKIVVDENVQTAKGLIFTNMKDLYDRLIVLVGEVQAGNTSKRLKNELAEIAHHLYRNNVISKPKYSTLLKAI